MGRAFFDTNVLIYAFSLDDPRCERAVVLLEKGGMISVQCLNEFATVMRGKRRCDWFYIRECIAQIMAACGEPIALDREIHSAALDLAERFRIAVYDALIIAAARAADCDILYSEDMHDGLMVNDRLRIVNPFAAA